MQDSTKCLALNALFPIKMKKLQFENFHLARTLENLVPQIFTVQLFNCSHHQGTSFIFLLYLYED